MARHEHTASELVRTVTPGRLATWESDLLVPVGQALAIAAAVGLAAGTLALLWVGPGRDLAGGALWTWAGRIAGTAAALALVATTIAFVLGHRRALWQVEEWTDRDLDGDGAIGDPEPHTVRVEVSNKQQGQTVIADLPISPERLHALAVAILRNGRPFSRPGLRGVLTQTEYNRLAPLMVRRGLARDLPGNRRELTPAGRAVLRRVLEG